MGRTKDLSHVTDLATSTADAIAAREGCTRNDVVAERKRRGVVVRPGPRRGQPAAPKPTPAKPSAAPAVRVAAPVDVPEQVTPCPAHLMPPTPPPPEPPARVRKPILLTPSEAEVMRRLARHALTQGDARVLVRSPAFSSAVKKLGGIS